MNIVCILHSSSTHARPKRENNNRETLLASPVGFTPRCWYISIIDLFCPYVYFLEKIDIAHDNRIMTLKLNLNLMVYIFAFFSHQVSSWVLGTCQSSSWWAWSCGPCWSTSCIVGCSIWLRLLSHHSSSPCTSCYTVNITRSVPTPPPSPAAKRGRGNLKSGHLSVSSSYPQPPN